MERGRRSDEKKGYATPGLRRAALRRQARRMGGPGALEEQDLFRPSAQEEIESLESIPDLLDPGALLSVPGARLCGALDFAFAGGGCLQLLEHLMDGATLAPSDWSPESYQDDLFLEEFVESCMAVVLGNWQAPINREFLVRFLSSPPRDPAVLEFRRTILEELIAQEPLRGALEGLYRLLVRLRRCFDLDEVSPRQEATRRRIETLTLIRRIIETAQEGFRESTSGLGRIHEYATLVRNSTGFGHMVELLEYENDLARVDLRLQLGADGRVRGMEILSMEEREETPLRTSPLRRLLARVALLFRGYRFSREELVDRALDHVFDGIKHFLPPLFQLLGQAEVYLAALAFRDLCSSQGLSLSFPELTHEGGYRLEGLFNPLLLTQGITPVTATVEEESFLNITLVTGPNSGGKTRLLQALGLTQLLAQVGLQAPVARARLRPATGLFVSLMGVHPKADQREGRLGTELIRIRSMFETSEEGSLVLLDELCSGTNPSEGEEIFHLVLTLLSELAPEAFISTHFLELTRRLSLDPGELNLSFLQVDLDEGRHPAFTFGSGVATTSLASQTAARLGVTRQELWTLVQQGKERSRSRRTGKKESG